MNLLKIDLIKDRSALAAACGGRLPAACQPEGFIGVRPEALRMDRQGLPVRIAAIDYLGAETVVRMEHDDQLLFAKIDGRHDLTPGATLHINWPETAVQCFGADGIGIDASENASSG